MPVRFSKETADTTLHAESIHRYVDIVNRQLKKAVSGSVAPERHVYSIAFGFTRMSRSAE